MGHAALDEPPLPPLPPPEEPGEASSPDPPPPSPELPQPPNASAAPNETEANQRGRSTGRMVESPRVDATAAPPSARPFFCVLVAPRPPCGRAVAPRCAGTAPVRAAAEPGYLTASLTAFTGRARTALLAGFAANICFSLVKGLMPSRAGRAGFFTTTNFAKPGRTKMPFFLSSLWPTATRVSTTCLTCLRDTSSPMASATALRIWDFDRGLFFDVLDLAMARLSL